MEHIDVVTKFEYINFTLLLQIGHLGARYLQYILVCPLLSLIFFLIISHYWVTLVFCFVVVFFLPCVLEYIR